MTGHWKRRSSRMLLMLGSCWLIHAPAAAQTPEDQPSAEAQAPADKDAKLAGPPVADGLPLFSTPAAPAQKIPSAPVAITPNAIVAEASTTVSEQHKMLADAAEVGQPFRFTLASGSYFHLVRGDDGDRYCLVRVPLEAFTPPADEKGEIFPSLCLDDKDGDGKYEVAHLLPYRRDSVSPRDVEIRPVSLVPVPDTPDPRASSLSAHRRLRVVAVTEASATFVVEDAVDQPGRTGELAWRKSSDPLSIFLEPGAEGQVAGLTLRIGGKPGKWTVTPEQGFLPWVSVADNGAGLRVGSFSLKPKAL